MFVIIVTAKHSTVFVPVIGLSSNRVLACLPGLSCGKYFDSSVHVQNYMWAELCFLFAAEETFKFATNLEHVSTFSY